jgi:hypothetical protein
VNYFLLPCGADLILERWVFEALWAVETDRKDRSRFVSFLEVLFGVASVATALYLRSGSGG